MNFTRLKMKHWVFMAVTTVVVLVFSSISVADTDVDWVTKDRIGNPDAEITLTFWAMPSITILTPYETQRKNLEERYLSWAKKNPNVKINVMVMPTGGAIAPQMTKAIQALKVGKGPDILSIDPFCRGMFYGKGVLQPMEEYLTEKEMDDFYPFLREMLTYKGHFLTLPTDADLRAFYYRKDLMEEPPRTWDELIEKASRIAKEKKIAGFLYNGGRWEGTTCDALGYFWAQGGKLVDEDGGLVFNEGNNRESLLNILEFFGRTVESGASPPWVGTIKEYDVFNAQAKAGQVAMFVGGNWQYAQLQEILPPEEFEKWVIAEIPQLEAHMYGTTASGWTIGITTDDPIKKRIAFDFIWENLVSLEGGGLYCEAGGYLAPRKSIYEKLYHFRTDESLLKFGDLLENAGAQPGFNLYPVFSEQFQIAVGKVLTGVATPETALDEVWQNVKAYEEESE